MRLGSCAVIKPAERDVPIYASEGLAILTVERLVCIRPNASSTEDQRMRLNSGNTLQEAHMALYHNFEVLPRLRLGLGNVHHHPG